MIYYMELHEIFSELIIVWFLWTLLHEMSHAVFAKILLKAKDFKFKLFPHINENKKFLFASVSWIPLEETRTDTKEAIVLLAPRLMNLVAAIAFPFLLLFPMPFAMAWAILWGAGLVDLFVGSLGISSESDIRRAGKLLNFNSNVIRILGLATILASIFASLSTQ